MRKKLYKNIEVEVAILAGIMGFFISGMLNVKKEIVEIALTAVTGGVIVSFIAYFVMVMAGKGKDRENFGSEKGKSSDNNSKKGKKVDIVVGKSDIYEEIYNIKK